MADQTSNADLAISADEIRDALKDFVKAYEPGKTAANEVGYVTDAGDGIAHVQGLPGVMANELIRFADGTSGLALNLSEDEIGALGSATDNRDQPTVPLRSIRRSGDEQ